MNRVSLASFALCAAGCGGTITQGTGGSGGDGGSGASGGTGGTGGTTTTTITTTPTLPPECAIVTNLPAPHAVQIDFTNTTPNAYFLREDCYLNFSIQSCADGYTEALSLSGACTTDCSESNAGCIDCGACPELGVAVAPGDTIEGAWSGLTFTFEQTSNGCSCHEEHHAPAGKYRVKVPVFASEEDALMNKVAFEVVQDFELPAPEGTLLVQLVPTGN